MELIFYFLAPVVTLLYKYLDHKKWVDKFTGRKLRISGLNRLKTTRGFPEGWIFDDEKDSREFRALFKTIRNNTKSEKLKTIFDHGPIPNLITVGGAAYIINGVEEKWDQHERTFYSSNHPVMVVFGVNRQGGKGKGEKACTIGELEKWIDDEKKNREFWVGTVSISLLSIGLIMGRLAYKNM